MDLQLFDENKFNQAVKLATTLSKSSIVPQSFRGKPEDVFAALVLGAELGFQPMQALNSIVMIQGSATLKSSTMLALAKANIKDLGVEIVESVEEVRATIRRGSNSYTATWNDSKASAMGLLGKDNYRKQKHTMYRWRAVSEALKIMCPDILMGLNMSEELEDEAPIRNDPFKELQQAAKEDADRMRIEQSTPEDTIVGPLYLINNGKFRNLRFWEIDPIDLEEYGKDIAKRKTKSSWETELMNAIESYFANYESYREQILELGDEVRN